MGFKRGFSGGEKPPFLGYEKGVFRGTKRGFLKVPWGGEIFAACFGKSMRVLFWKYGVFAGQVWDGWFLPTDDTDLMNRVDRVERLEGDFSRVEHKDFCRGEGTEILGRGGSQFMKSEPWR